MSHDVDRAELDELFSASYAELRRLAASVKRDDPGATLNPTELVAEAWVRLARSRRLHIESELHFRRIAARAMRRVLVEAARRRKAAKRGGGEALVTLDEGLDASESTPDQVLALDEALHGLHALEPRQAQLVELRFFGGLELAEAARLVGVSAATASRDWRAARAWLARELATT